MGLFFQTWKRFTHTKALDLSSGKFETMFFESVYRVAYLLGFSGVDRNWSYLIYGNTMKLLMILLTCSELTFVFTTTFNVDAVIDSVNIILIRFSAVYKYIELAFKRDIFKGLASSMESPYFDVSTQERKDLVDQWKNLNESYVRFLLGLGTCTLVVWYTYPLVDDLEYNFMTAIRLPYDHQTLSRYVLTYCVALVLFSYIAYFVIVIDITMQAHTLHLLCQFAVLDNCFRSLLPDCCDNVEDLNHNIFFTTEEFQQKYTHKLNNYIKQHQLILNHVSTLKALLSGPMLMQLAISTILICSIGYQVLTNTENYTKCLMSLMYLGYNMSVLYIFCRWCEEVTIQSENIGEAAYCSGWECGITSVPGVKSRLLIIIARANKPLVLTAGGMYDLTLTSYSNMVKTSYSALTLLLQFRE